MAQNIQNVVIDTIPVLESQVTGPERRVSESNNHLDWNQPSCSSQRPSYSAVEQPDQSNYESQISPHPTNPIMKVIPIPQQGRDKKTEVLNHLLNQVKPHPWNSKSAELQSALNQLRQRARETDQQRCAPTCGSNGLGRNSYSRQCDVTGRSHSGGSGASRRSANDLAFHRRYQQEVAFNEQYARYHHQYAAPPWHPGRESTQLYVPPYEVPQTALVVRRREENESKMFINQRQLEWTFYPTLSDNCDVMDLLEKPR